MKVLQKKEVYNGNTFGPGSLVFVGKWLKTVVDNNYADWQLDDDGPVVYAWQQSTIAVNLNIREDQKHKGRYTMEYKVHESIMQKLRSMDLDIWNDDIEEGDDDTLDEALID